MIATVTASTLAYTLTSGIIEGNSYKIQIAAVNVIGEGAKSQSSLFYAVDIPTAPTLTVSDAQTDSCTVTWGAVTPPANTVITGYQIYYDTMTGNGYSIGCDFTNNPSQLSCKISNLQTGQKVAIKANSMNKGGLSIDSTVVYCTAVGKPGQPGTPRLVSSSASSIQVEWTGASNTGGLPITSYKLFMDEEEVAPTAYTEVWTQIYDGPLLTATKSSGLIAGRSYRFKVQAVNSANQGLFSNVASFLAASTPQAPGSFAVASASRNWMQLTWTKSTSVAGTDPPVAGYIVSTDYGNKPTFTTLANITNGNQLSLNITGQQTGSTYKFRITAYNLVGSSVAPADISGTFADPPTKPQAPFLVSSTKTSVSTATLTIGWTPVSDTGGVPITGYKLYMLDTVTSSTTTIYDSTASPSTTQYAATGLTLARKYRFYITAMNPKESAQSDQIELIAAGLPAKITDVTEVANSRTTTCIGLQWSAPDNGGSTILLYELSSMESSTNLLRYSGSNTQAYLCDLNTGQSYRFIVQAINGAGKGTMSDPFVFQIAGLPSSPRYLRTSTISSSSISLIWEVPTTLGGTSLTGFKVYRKLASDSTYTILATVDPSVVVYSDNTVSSGVKYNYVVSSSNSIGDSPYSDSIEIIAMSVPAQPAAPTLLSKDRFSIRIGWTAPAANGGTIQGYNVYMRKQSLNDYSLAYTGAATEFLAGGLTSGVTYYFKVSANNAAGESLQSDPSVGVLTADKPSAPTNLKVISRSSTSITIQWDLPTNTGGVPLTGYVVESAKGTASYAEIAFSGNNNPAIVTFTHSSLSACEIYSYRVTSVNIDGRGLPSQTLQVISSALPNAPANPPTISSTTRYSASLTLGVPTDNGGCPITFYKVYMSTNGGQFIETASSLTTSITLNGLQLSAIYQIKYAASNRVFDENNNYQEQLKFSPIQTLILSVLPQPPQNFRLGQLVYRDSVYFEWDMPTDTGGSLISGYEMTITDVAASTSNIISLTATSLSYTATGLIPGKTYSFKMVSKTSAGSSVFTNEIQAIPGLLPIKPIGLATNTKTRTGFTLTWTALANEDTGGTAANQITISEYKIQLRNLNTGSISELSTTGNSYNIQYLLPGTNYGLKVRACTVIGCSDYSSEIQDSAGLVPTSPLLLTLVKQSSSEISIQWQEPPDDGGNGLIGYKVGITVDGTETVKQGIYTLSYKFTGSDGLVVGKTYLFRVAAQNSIGYGPWTSQITAYSSNLPNAIASLTATSVTQYSATINWVLLTTADTKGYSISDPTYSLESSNCLTDSYTLLTSTTTLNTYSYIGATPGSCLKFRMKVTNNIGDSAYTQPLEVLFAVAPSAPAAPILINRNAIPSPFIKVGWTAPLNNGGSQILGYLLEQYSGSSWSTIYDGRVNADIKEYTSQNLVAGTQYKFRVSARNIAGTSTASSELIINAGTIPTSPLNLRITAKTVSGSSSKLTLTWDAPQSNGGSAITNYYIKYKDVLSTGNELTIPTGSTTNTFDLTNLYAGVSYQISVAATNTIYDSNNLEGLVLQYSTQITALVADVPAKITTITQQDSSDPTKILISWVAPSDGGSPITSYSLYKDNGSGTFYVLYTGLDKSYTDASLTAGTSYNYKILSTNNAGNSVYSDPVTFKAGSKSSVPKNLRATTQSSTSIVVTWDAPDNNGGFAITKYWVVSDNGDMTYSAPFDNALVTAFTKTVTAPLIGQRFRFKIAAENAIGVSAYTSELVVLAADKPPAPTLQIIDSSRTKTTCTVKWTQPVTNGGSQIIGYILRRDDGIAGSAYTTVYNGVNIPQRFSYVLTGLVTGRTYNIQIVSVNSVGESATAGTATLLAGTKPSKIDTVTFVSSANSGKISISWTQPVDNGGIAITKYKLYISQVGSALGAGTDYTNLVTLSNEFTGLTGGTLYQIAVSSVNTIGESDLSNILQAPAADVPTAPSSLSVISSTKYFFEFSLANRTSVNIKWNVPASTGGNAINSYKVYLNDGVNSNWNNVNCNPAPALTSTPVCGITGLTTGASYSVKITAVNLAGESVASSVLSIISATAPLAPGQPTLTGSTTSSISIAWTPPTDDGGSPLTNYEVYGKLATDPETSWTQLTSVTPDVLSYTHSGIAVPGSWMQYKIRCKTNFGYSDYSTISSFIAATVPTMNAPTLVSASKTSMTVSWTANTNGGSAITGYILSRADTADGKYSVIYDGTKISSVTSYTSTVTAGNSYKFTVVGINSVGKSSSSPESTAFLAASLPAAPSTPVFYSSTDTVLTLTLGPYTNDNGGSAITKMHLYMATVGSSTFSEITQYNSLDSQYALDKAIITTLATGTSYQFYTTAQNAVGEGPKSLILIAGLGALPSAMIAPTTDYSQSTGDSLQISWAAGTSTNLPITGYQVYMHNSPATLIYDGRNNANIRTFTATGLTKGVKYYFYVVAWNVNGAGPNGAETSFYACTAPSVPGNPIRTASTKLSLTLSWTPPTSDGGCPLIQYRLYVNDGLTGQPTTEVTPADFLNLPSLNSYTINTLTLTGNTYKFKLRAENSVGYTESAIVEYVLAGVPSKPAAATQDYAGSSTTSVKLTIADIIGDSNTGGSKITSMEIERSPNGLTTYTKIISVPMLLLTYTDTGLTKGTQYKYRYRVANVNGWSDFSDDLIATAGGAPGKPQVITQNGLTANTVSLVVNGPTDNGGLIVSQIDLEMGAGTNNPTFAVKKTSASDATYTLGSSDGLTAGQIYSFRSRAKNSAGYGPYSDIFVVGVGVLPTTPTGLQTDVTKNTANSIYAKWNLVTVGAGELPIMGYRVNIKLSSAADTAYNVAYDGISNPSQNFAFIYGLTAGESYSVTVVSYNVNGKSTASSPVIIKSCGLPNAPNSPTLVKSEATGITIGWAIPGNNGGCPLTGFDIFIYRTDTQLYDKVNTGSDSDPTMTSFKCVTTSCLPATAVLGQKFVFKLRSKNNAPATSLDSDTSTQLLFADVPATPSSAPSNIVSGTSTSQINVQLSEITTTNGSPIISYELQMSEKVAVQTWNTVQNTLSLSAIINTGINGGSSYEFRYRAINSIGASGWSPSIIILAASVPSKMSAPTISISSTNLRFSWSAATQNGSPISEYKLQILKKSDMTYADSGCDGTVAPAITDLYCDLTPATVKTNFGYSDLDTPVTRITAKNAVGYGEYSDKSSSTTVIPTLPAKPPIPIKNSAQTIGTQIQISITALTGNTQTGGSPIISYTIQWDQGTGTWVDIQTSMLLTYTATGLTLGTTYAFKYKATNAIGSGIFSDPLSIKAVNTPAQIAAPTGTYGDGTQVVIQWTAPNSNGGTISAYRVITQGNSGQIMSNAYCTEGISPTTKCTIPMSSLWASPFSLTTPGSSISMKVQAYNEAGWSTLSDQETGSLIIKTKPLAPPSGPEKDATTTYNSLVVKWAAFSTDFDGKSTITEYSLLWDSGSGADPSIEVYKGSATTTTITTGISPGQNYKFKYAGTNIFGTGPYSQIVTITVPSTNPTAPGAPTTVLDTNNIKICWTAPSSTGGSDITNYNVYVRDKTDLVYKTNSNICQTVDLINNCCTADKTLVMTNYNLGLGDEVKAQVEAINMDNLVSPRSAETVSGYIIS